MVTLCNAQTDLQEAVQALLLSSITGDCCARTELS
jgi:hypothetical protein